MLEQGALVLRPPDDRGLRAIVSDTGQPLGYAWWRPPRRPWWRLAPPVLAVHEQEDEPLLFTVRRRWPLLPGCELRDAEGRPVGYLRGPRISDRLGRCVARREKGAEGSACCYRHPAGRALGEVARADGGAVLRFAPAVRDDPFAKMLLLGAALLETGPG
jgi:hypothetical protein